MITQRFASYVLFKYTVLTKIKLLMLLCTIITLH